SVHHEGPLLEVKQTLKTLLFDGFDAFLCALFRQPARSSKGRQKLNWEAEFQVIEQQFLEGEVR
ncbi:transposase, partial [Halalkalibacter alkalisediminis]